VKKCFKREKKREQRGTGVGGKGGRTTQNLLCADLVI
jgi:hypothetical protein